MRNKFYSLVLALALVCMLVLVPASPAQADVSCTVTALGDSANLTVACSDENGDPVSPSDIDVQSIVGNTVTLVVTEVETVTKTVRRIVRVPGPVRTITARPKPRATKTVYVPGETRTVYIRGETRTRTVTVPGPTVTETATPDTIITTVTATPTGQNRVEDGKVEPRSDGNIVFPSFSLGKPATAVGIGLLTLLALVGLILLAMYGGYILGYKDSERESTNFMRALRDSMMTRGKHS